MNDHVHTPADTVEPELGAPSRWDGLRDKLAYQSLMPGFMLGLVALLASGALALASMATTGPIAAAEENDLRRSLSEVLPEGFADNNFIDDTVTLSRDGASVTVYRARMDGVAKAAMFKVSGYGYSSDVQIMMAVGVDGRILGVRVLKHAETPGLGDKIEITKSKWILGFNGRSLEDPVEARWAVKKDGGDFDQLTGATITPRAVVKAVKGGLLFFEANRQQMLGEAK